jgi:hypothetical protein
LHNGRQWRFHIIAYLSIYTSSIAINDAT